jgi:hypothetical protein
MKSDGDRSSDRIRSASLRKRTMSNLDAAASAPVMAVMPTSAAKASRRDFHFVNLAAIPAPPCKRAENPSLPHTSFDGTWSTVTYRQVKRGGLRDIMERVRVRRQAVWR